MDFWRTLYQQTVDVLTPLYPTETSLFKRVERCDSLLLSSIHHEVCPIFSASELHLVPAGRVEALVLPTPLVPTVSITPVDMGW
jgi:hypothetical protein